jgi:hypothetical protein
MLMLEHEKRLDDVVPAGKFGDGEAVEIRTKMGTTVSRGNVLSVTPFGLIVRESTGDTKFYKDTLYLFASLETEPPTVVKDQLHDASLDARVQAKLASMSEAGDPTPDDTGAKPIDPNATDADYKDKDGDDKDDEEKKPEKKDDDKKKKAVADPESSIDTDKLPDDIKAAIISTHEMDEGQLNNVLRDISDAALKSLKRTGISESEIFGIIQKINDASFEVLTGKKPGDSSKKNGKKE